MGHISKRNDNRKSDSSSSKNELHLTEADMKCRIWNCKEKIHQYGLCRDHWDWVNGR